MWAEQTGWHGKETCCQGRPQLWATMCCCLQHTSPHLPIWSQLFYLSRFTAWYGPIAFCPPPRSPLMLSDSTPLSNSRQRVAHTIMHHLKAEEFFTTINSKCFNQLPFSHVSWKAFSATHWLGFSKLSQYALVIELQPEKINWEGLSLCCFPRHAC